MKRNYNEKTLYGAKYSSIAFLSMMFIYFVLSLVGQSIIIAIGGENSLLLYIVSPLFSVVSMTVLIILTSKFRKENILKTAQVNRCNPIFFVASIFLTLAIFLCFGWVNQYIYEFAENIGLKVSSISLPLDNIFYLILFIVLYALLPAVLEESFFRGLLFNELLKNNKRVLSIAIISLLFAIYHCSITQFFYQFIFGIAFSFLAEKSRSILPCVFSHFLNNTAVLILEYIGLTENIYNVLTIIIGFVSLLIFISILVLFGKKEKKHNENEETLKDFFLPYGLFSVFMCLIIIVLGLFV